MPRCGRGELEFNSQTSLQIASQFKQEHHRGKEIYTETYRIVMHGDGSLVHKGQLPDLIALYLNAVDRLSAQEYLTVLGKEPGQDVKNSCKYCNYCVQTRWWLSHYKGKLRGRTSARRDESRVGVRQKMVLYALYKKYLR